MNTADWIVVALLAAALVWAFVSSRRRRRQGKTCSGNCADCGGQCPK